MTSEDLKSLVKEYFNLVEATPETETTVEAFGELKDVNGAFTIKFPGAEPTVGDKVTVVTAEDQEMEAPDGYHELEGGVKVKTEGSVITEIAGTEEEAKEEEMAEEVVTEGEMPVEGDTVTPDDIKNVIEEIAEAMKAELGKMKEKMAELEEKVATIDSTPAAEKTIPTMASKFSVEEPKAFNSSTQEMMIEMIKNKKK